MNKRVSLIAVIAIALVLVIEGVFAIRLSTNSQPRHQAFPGQVLAVNLDGPWTELTSSDASVVAPMRISLSPTVTGYFLALRPGKATLMAQSHPSCLDAQPRCLIVQMVWSAEVDVRLWPWTP
jgi:hypothetical protein